MLSRFRHNPSSQDFHKKNNLSLDKSPSKPIPMRKIMRYAHLIVAIIGLGLAYNLSFSNSKEDTVLAISLALVCIPLLLSPLFGIANPRG